MADTILIDLDTMKTNGRAYMATHEIDKALETYVKILEMYPDDVESHLILGDLYLTAGDQGTAAHLYAKALRIEPENTDIVHRIQLATPEHTPEQIKPGEPVPTHPMAIARLLQRLTGRDHPLNDEEINRAAKLLDRIVTSADPATTVANHLEEIDSLLPALIELNIRQAQSDGRPDLANALKDLQTNIRLQLDIHSTGKEPGSIKKYQPNSNLGKPVETGQVLFLTPEPSNPSSRVLVIADALENAGYHVALSSQPASLSAEQNFELTIASNPHASPALMEWLGICSARKVPIILDLDADYEQMPITHPAYSMHGLGTPAQSKAYLTSFLLADTITVSSETLAFRLKSAGYPAVEYIPDGWSKKNSLWNKPGYPRHSLNIGWTSGPGEIEDLAQIRRVIIRVLREFPQTQWIVNGDPQAYQLFDSIPEARRLYLPPVPYDDYPYMLGQIDILLAPFRNIPYYRGLSDQLLVEAGVRSIPWIASPIPSFVTWQAGGLIASTIDEWHTYTRQLVMDADLRVALGRNGRQQAEKRESQYLGKTWQQVIQKTTNRNPAPVKEERG